MIVLTRVFNETTEKILVNPNQICMIQDSGSQFSASLIRFIDRSVEVKEDMGEIRRLIALSKIL